MKECEHKNKVFANFSYATDPPKTPWICSDCGDEGIHVTAQYKINETYESIKRKFETENS